jgi:hypothetical protein
VSAHTVWPLSYPSLSLKGRAAKEAVIELVMAEVTAMALMGEES